MKTKKLVFLISILFVLFAGYSARAQGGQQLTTTLLPVDGNSLADTESGDNYLLLKTETETIKGHSVLLQFDLKSLPEGLERTDFSGCTLSMAAKDGTGQTCIIKLEIAGNNLAKPENKTPEFISDFELSANKNLVFFNDDQLANAVFSKYSTEKIITFRLYTNSGNVNRKFHYFNKDTGASVNPSYNPRLIIEFKPKPQGFYESMGWLQHQHNPEHTGRQPWVPFRNPANFCLNTISLPQIDGINGGIADYPLIYRGNLYLVGKFNNENYLFSLDFKGNILWPPCAVGAGKIQRSPAISSDGIIYIVTENQTANHIAAYDLKQSEKSCQPQTEHLSTYPLKHKLDGKLSAYTDLTIGNDGSIFLALDESDDNYIYGFTPNLQPFLKAGPFGKGEDKISTITVSRDGRKIFAQVPTGAVVIDITNPLEQQKIDINKKLVNSPEALRSFEYYHVPVAGPGGNVMIFSDFPPNEHKSNVWGYTAPGDYIWNSASDKTLVSQPVCGFNEYIYYIQEGQLQQHKYKNIGQGKILTKGKVLNFTSNLVMDGADNIYFWDNGLLHGYKPDGTSMFKSKDDSETAVIVNKCDNSKKDDENQGRILERNKNDKGEEIHGPERFIRLMMGPDGTLWTNNKNGGEIFVLQPLYDAVNLTLRQEDIKSRTAYRVSGILSVGDGNDKLTVQKDMQLLFQAQEGVGFAKGFRVEKGASINVRTGF
ncbi:MAG: hypothetical protein HGA29_01140 [Syntrophaceae bacterium]|nr:hypothetical protein [Syntrophaceae bacterium]